MHYQMRLVRIVNKFANTTSYEVVDEEKEKIILRTLCGMPTFEVEALGNVSVDLTIPLIEFAQGIDLQQLKDALEY